jgi:hypothetical protein
MSDTIRSFRSFGIYLLPVFLLAIAGASLLALLYYPAPLAIAAVESRPTGAVDRGDWQAHAETMFAAMLMDALRELHSEQETQARTLMYRYEQNPFSAEHPALLRIAPPVIENADGGSSRSGLIRL